MVFLVSALFMALGSLNAWLISILPADITEEAEPPSLDPLVNLIGPVSTHIFVIVAIFAVMALIVAERESGTLAWTASKPVSRSAIWLAKFASASGMLWIVAGILPLLATVAVVVVLYGSVPATTVAAVALGMAMIIALYVALGTGRLHGGDQPGGGGRDHACGDRAGADGRGDAAGSDPHADVDPRLVGEARGRRAGRDPRPVISWALTVGALIAFSLRRMERMEL